MATQEQEIFVGDIGTEIIVDIGESIVGATETKLKVKKPSGATVTWNGEVYNDNYVKYTVVSGDLDEAGVYYVNAEISIGTWTGHGTADKFIVRPLYLIS